MFKGYPHGIAISRPFYRTQKLVVLDTIGDNEMTINSQVENKAENEAYRLKGYIRGQ